MSAIDDRCISNLQRELSDERRDHQQTIRVMSEEIQRLKAENALIAESYKKAHEEVVRLRMEMSRSGADD